jgi:hypothetical protein
MNLDQDGLLALDGNGPEALTFLMRKEFLALKLYSR